MNKDQANGRITELKGKAKEMAGKLVGDKDLENKGKAENIKGKIQATYGDAKADIEQATHNK